VNVTSATHRTSQSLRLRRPAAFTLIEMLVAAAVLALMALLITQIITMSSSSISATTKKLDAVSDGRFAMDRIGADLAARIKRGDVPSSFEKVVGNDGMAFYAEVPGYSGTRNTALVEYRIPSSGRHEYQLERGVSGVGWTGPTDIPFQSVSLPTLADADFDVLSGSVLRLEFSYLLDNGKIQSTYASTDKVKAIVVAMAALDAKSRKILKPEDLSSLAGALPDPAEGETPLAAWQRAISLPGFASGVPDQSKQGIRLFQRFYEVR